MNIRRMRRWFEVFHRIFVGRRRRHADVHADRIGVGFFGFYSLNMRDMRMMFSRWNQLNGPRKHFGGRNREDFRRL